MLLLLLLHYRTEYVLASESSTYSALLLLRERQQILFSFFKSYLKFSVANPRHAAAQNHRVYRVVEFSPER